MASQAQNRNLADARAARMDEFYTQLSDIERELKGYKEHFRGKVVYCNCDDPRVSNFFHYFSYNFERLGLKRLITTCYRNQQVDLFSQNVSESAISLVYDGDRSGNRVPDPEDIGITALTGDGDFRSSESIELLKQADIVVTNPPFSLLKEYVAQLVDHDKKFVIVGSRNATTYREIFKLIKDNALWLGYGFQAGNAYFAVPDTRVASDYAKGVYDEATGLVKFRNACWFTNLDIKKRHEELTLYRKYNAADYPKYINYDAIDVARIRDIPDDYDGVMGVPVTLLDQFNPDQFELVGNSDDAEMMKEIGVHPLGEAFIKAYKGAGGTGHRTAGMRMLGLMEPQPRVVFKRILIRRRTAAT
jgi:hypothetical protein